MSVSLSLNVNGKAVREEVDPRTLLVEFIRNDLALTGTHVGCDTGQCGACTVLIDGHAVKSCTILALQAEGAEVTTIEGLAPDGTLHPMQAAFKECHGLQCGFCTPGMVMSAIDLVQPAPQCRRGDHPRRARGQPVPLHRLPEHRQGGGAGRRRHAEDKSMGANDLNSIGQSIRRKEDYRFLTGAGQYTDDVNPAAPALCRFSCARRTRTPSSGKIDTAKAQGRARRDRDLHRGGHRPASTACPAAG